jgi:hypothetical protein
MRPIVWTGLVLAAGLAACEPVLEAPRNAGVCWRMAEAMNGRQDFRPMSTNVENLETCASQLEGLRLQHGQPVTGAFQGRYIYVTAEEISVAAGPKAQRYRVFTPQQRAKIQAGYAALRKAG